MSHYFTGNLVTFPVGFARLSGDKNCVLWRRQIDPKYAV